MISLIRTQLMNNVSHLLVSLFLGAGEITLPLIGVNAAVISDFLLLLRTGSLVRCRDKFCSSLHLE